MSAFTNGFNHGFFHGMFNRMFGGFGMFNNWCGWNSAPTFFTPNYSFGNFFQYQSPTLPMPTMNFSMPMMPMPMTMPGGIFNNNITSFPAMNTNMNMSWQNFSGPSMNFWQGNFDTFSFSGGNSVKKEKVEKEIDYDTKKLKDKWEKLKGKGLSNEFYSRITKISKEINCDPNDLMGIINIETAGSLSPDAQNPSSKATGLIQFMPKTAKSYGTNINALKKMTAEKQLDYVEMHFKKVHKSCKLSGQIDAATLYAMVFWPAASNKEDSYVIARRGSSTYKQNKGLDYDNDGAITKADLGRCVAKHRA